MPKLVSYGTMRAVQEVKTRKLTGRFDLFDKICALEDCIGKSKDFTQYFEWLRRRQEIENGICESLEELEILLDDLKMMYPNETNERMFNE